MLMIPALENITIIILPLLEIIILPLLAIIIPPLLAIYQSTSFPSQAKMLRKGKTKQQRKGGAFFLRAPPLRTRNTAEVL